MKQLVYYTMEWFFRCINPWRLFSERAIKPVVVVHLKDESHSSFKSVSDWISLDEWPRCCENVNLVDSICCQIFYANIFLFMHDKVMGQSSTFCRFPLTKRKNLFFSFFLFQIYECNLPRPRRAPNATQNTLWRYQIY